MCLPDADPATHPPSPSVASDNVSVRVAASTISTASDIPDPAPPRDLRLSPASRLGRNANISSFTYPGATKPPRKHTLRPLARRITRSLTSRLRRLERHPEFTFEEFILGQEVQATTTCADDEILKDLVIVQTKPPSRIKRTLEDMMSGQASPAILSDKLTQDLEGMLGGQAELNSEYGRATVGESSRQIKKLRRSR